MLIKQSQGKKLRQSYGLLVKYSITFLDEFSFENGYLWIPEGQCTGLNIVRSGYFKQFSTVRKYQIHFNRLS